jgi:AhpD family alkylhydroperoxidase
MEPRIDYLNNGRGAFDAMFGLEKYLAQSGLDHKLMTLIKLRASQINGCAYCIDMHWKDLRAAGESEQRLYGPDAWRESPYLHRAGARRPRLDRSGHKHPARSGCRRSL